MLNRLFYEITYYFSVRSLDLKVEFLSKVKSIESYRYFIRISNDLTQNITEKKAISENNLFLMY